MAMGSTENAHTAGGPPVRRRRTPAILALLGLALLTLTAGAVLQSPPDKGGQGAVRTNEDRSRPADLRPKGPQTAPPRLDTKRGGGDTRAPDAGTGATQAKSGPESKPASGTVCPKAPPPRPVLPPNQLLPLPAVRC
jgi:hypothetical protein